MVTVPSPTRNTVPVAIVISDFDGVMTDNRVHVSEDGRESVVCNRADGLGCDILRAKGIALVIVSTEENPVVTARGRKLKVGVLQAVRDKRAAVEGLLANSGLDRASAMYIGNDVNDLTVLQWVGWPVAPADAHADVLSVARLVTRAAGGGGVIREVADWIAPRKGVAP